MKKIIITATVMCLSICLWAQGKKGITASRLAEGDLLFCVAESGNNITGLSGNLVGISINLCKSIQKELFINDAP